MLPLLPADGLRALGLVLVPAAWAVAGWPSAAVMLLVSGGLWLLRWLSGGSALDWVGQAVLLAAGWFSVVGLYHRVEGLDTVVHAAASGVVAGLVALALRSWLRRPRAAPAESAETLDAAALVRAVGPGPAVVVLAGLTLALGAVWELAEWWGHHAVTAEIGVGYDDTMVDLLADLAGGLVGSALAVRAALRGRA